MRLEAVGPQVRIPLVIFVMRLITCKQETLNFTVSNSTVKKTAGQTDNRWQETPLQVV